MKNTLDSFGKNIIKKGLGAVGLNQLFFKHEIENILDTNIRISHLIPEDNIRKNNQIKQAIPLTERLYNENIDFFVGKITKDDFKLLFNLVKRRYKKINQENAIKTIKFIINKLDNIEHILGLAKFVSNCKSFTDLLDGGFSELFDAITDENVSEKTTNNLILEYLSMQDIQKTDDEIFNERFFNEIYLSSSFEPEEELMQISSLKLNEKKLALDNFYKKIRLQIDTLASLPAKIKSINIVFANEGMNYWEYAKLLVHQLESDFKILSVDQRKKAIKSISEYCSTRILMNEYGDISNYYNNPKEILGALLNLPTNKLEGGIYYEQEFTSAIFYIANENDYEQIYTSYFGNKKDAELSGGFYTTSSIIPISIIRGAKFFNIRSEITKEHELRHSENRIIMPENTKNDFLTNAKDEIIAYIYDGYNNFEDIKRLLFERKENGGIYDYYANYKSNNTHYQELRKHYEKDLDNIIKIAKYMKDLEIPNYLEILSIVPVRKWHILTKIYKKEEIIESDETRIKKMIEIFGEIKKIY